jgi:hypothetical protein
MSDKVFRDDGHSAIARKEFTAADRMRHLWSSSIRQWPNSFGLDRTDRHLTRGNKDPRRLRSSAWWQPVNTAHWAKTGIQSFSAVGWERGLRSTFVVHARDPQALCSPCKGGAELDRGSLFRGWALWNARRSLFPARTTGLLFSVFGAVATLLVVSGLFGVIAYSVSQRTREIGVRMALGASRRDVSEMVLRQGLNLIAAGIGIGLVGALAATRLLGSLLYGINATDALVRGHAVALTGVALLACWRRARRAYKVAPMEALRCE